MLFAFLLFIQEISTIYTIEIVDAVLRRNFGFLFKPFGKGAFIIFIAFLNFGLDTGGPADDGGDNDLGLATGIVSCAFGALYVILFLQKPEYFEEPAKYQAAPGIPPGPGY